MNTGDVSRIYDFSPAGSHTIPVFQTSLYLRKSSNIGTVTVED